MLSLCTFSPSALIAPTYRRHGTVNMLADPPIADLSGGEDADRNAAVASLKSLFYAPDPPKDLPGRRDASRLGLMLDVPLCRWSFEILPHQQAALNVFQPQYTHMFEALLSRPAPHYYFHVLLPGGTQSLGQSEYELKPGTEAPLAGTLMEVIHVRREPDSRLSLIVRGLSRGVVVRATQELPYSRGDVQLLADEEGLRDAARRVRRHLRNTPGAAEAAAARPGVRRRLVMAAAVAEERGWWAYEGDSGGATLHDCPPLSQLSASVVAADAAAAAAAAVEAAVETAPMAPAVCYRPENWEEEAAEEAAAQRAADDDGADDLYAGSPMVLDTLEAVAAAEWEVESELEAAEVAEEAAADDEATLVGLELQLWVELDAIIRNLSRTGGGRIAVPAQLLALMPPPPQAGWPEDFRLAGLADELRDRHAAAREDEAMIDAAFPAAQRHERTTALRYSPADAAYPPRRRAARLSYMVWTVLGGAAPRASRKPRLQPLLNETSSAGRLRRALIRLRDLAERLKLDGGPSWS